MDGPSKSEIQKRRVVMVRNEYSPDYPSVSGACVAGLFSSESDAESAIDDLKDAGFTESQIGVATAGQAQSDVKTGFWNKVTSAFGKAEHTETASELEASLQACGLPE